MKLNEKALQAIVGLFYLAETRNILAETRYNLAEGHFNLAEGYFILTEGSFTLTETYYNLTEASNTLTEGCFNLTEACCNFTEGYFILADTCLKRFIGSELQRLTKIPDTLPKFCVREILLLTHLSQKQFFRALPADVRKGSAFPSIALQVLRLRLGFNALKVRRSLAKKGEAKQKGTAFPHIGRHSRKLQ